MTALFVVAYAAPALGTACLAAALGALRRRPQQATGRVRAALSLGVGAATLWGGLAASDACQASTLGVGVVAYFLASYPLGLGVFALAAVLATPGVRLAVPRVPSPQPLAWSWAAVLGLGVALALAPFLLGKLAMGWDAAALR